MRTGEERRKKSGVRTNLGIVFFRDRPEFVSLAYGFTHIFPSQHDVWRDFRLAEFSLSDSG